MTSGLTAAQSPAHLHKVSQSWGSTSPAGPISPSFSGTVYSQWYVNTTQNSSSAGSSAGHNHAVPTPAALSAGVPFSNSIDFNLKYVDVIVAQRN